MWTRRAAGPRGAAGGGWGEGFPRMERAGRCAQPGKMGRAESWGARSYPGPSLLGARRGSLGTIGFVPRRWRALCPRKTKGATSVRVGNSELCSGSWILSLAGKESGPWRYCFLLPRRPASFLGRDSWLGRSGGQTQRRSPFPSWSVASFPGLAIFIPDVAAEGAGVG